MSRQSKQEMQDGYQAPSRLSGDSTPELARQARHDEGSRWTHMDADDATWARTPEERAWRELNAAPVAVQAAAPEDGGSVPFQLSSLFTFQPLGEPATPAAPFSHADTTPRAYDYARNDAYAYYEKYVEVQDYFLRDDYFYHTPYYDYDDHNRHLYYPYEFYRSYESPPSYYGSTYSYDSPFSYGYGGYSEPYGYSNSPYDSAGYSSPYYQSPSQPYEQASVAAASVIAAAYVAQDARDSYAQAAIDYTPQAWGSEYAGQQDSWVNEYPVSTYEQPSLASAASSYVVPELPKDDAAIAASYVMSRQAVQTQADAAGALLSDNQSALFGQQHYGASASPSALPYQEQTAASYYSQSLPSLSEPLSGRSDYLHSTASSMLSSSETPAASFIDSERTAHPAAHQAAWTQDMAVLDAVGGAYPAGLQADDWASRLTVNRVEDYSGAVAPSLLAGNTAETVIPSGAPLGAQSRDIGQACELNPAAAEYLRINPRFLDSGAAAPALGMTLEAGPFSQQQETVPWTSAAVVTQGNALSNRLTVNQVEDAAYSNALLTSRGEDINKQMITAAYQGMAESSYGAYTSGEHAAALLTASSLPLVARQDDLPASESVLTGRLQTAQATLLDEKAPYSVLAADEVRRDAWVEQVPGVLAGGTAFVREGSEVAGDVLFAEAQTSQLFTNQADDLGKRLTVNQVEEFGNRLTVNQVGAADYLGTPFTGRGEACLAQDGSGGAAYGTLADGQLDVIQAQAAANRDMRGWMAAAQEQSVPAGQPAAGEGLAERGVRATAAEEFLVTSPSRHQKAEGFILAEESMVKKQQAFDQIGGAPSIEALLKGQGSELSGTQGAAGAGRWGGRANRGPGNARAAGGSGPGPRNQGDPKLDPDALSPSEAKAAKLGLKSQQKAELADAELKAAGLGLAGLAGGALIKGAKGAAGLTAVIFDKALREDENLMRVADTAEVARDATTHMHKHSGKGKGGLASSVEDKLLSAMAAQDLMHQEQLEGSVLKIKKVDRRLKPFGEADAGELASNLRAEQVLDEKPDVLEKSPAGIRGKALEAGSAAGAEQFLVGRSDELDGAGAKSKHAKESLKSRFEKKLAQKRQERLAKRDAKSHGKALDSVKSVNTKAALLAEGAAISGAKKVLAKENEEIAIAFSMVDKARQVKNAARMPVRVYRSVSSFVQHAVQTLKAIWHSIAATASSSPVGAVLVLLIFMLLVLVIAALIGSASIINDEQEMSEVSALVAELDEDLTEEVQEMGADGILYCDARGTYGEKSGKKDLTKDVDLSDDKSDLKTVTASSVTVQTDPGEVVAYIDAKYTGNWQVGAASWKYTVDFNGKKWNIIEWEDMPEWCWKAINKMGKWGFYDKVSEGIWKVLTEDFGVSDEDAVEIGNGIADEFANVVFEQQVQGINEQVVNQVIEDGVKKYAKDLDLSDKDKKQLYLQLSKIVTDAIGEEDPFAFVYDEIVDLHGYLNWWSDDHGKFKTPSSSGGGTSVPTTGGGASC